MKLVKRTLLFIILGVALVSLQYGLNNIVNPYYWVIPNLILGLILYLGFYEINAYGAFLTFILGLILDLSTGYVLGPWSATYTVLFGVLALVSRRIFVESFFSFAFISGTSILYIGLFCPLVTFGTNLFFGRTIKEVILELLINVLILPFIIFFFKSILKKRSSYSYV